MFSRPISRREVVEPMDRMIGNARVSIGANVGPRSALVTGANSRGKRLRFFSRNCEIAQFIVCAVAAKRSCFSWSGREFAPVASTPHKRLI